MAHHRETSNDVGALNTCGAKIKNISVDAKSCRNVEHSM